MESVERITQAIKCLEDALALVADESRWSVGQFKSGDKYSLRGALYQTKFNDARNQWDDEKLSVEMQALVQALPKDCERRGTLARTLVCFNNHKGRTHAEVVALFIEAIGSLRSQKYRMRIDERDAIQALHDSKGDAPQASDDLALPMPNIDAMLQKFQIAPKQ